MPAATRAKLRIGLIAPCGVGLGAPAYFYPCRRPTEAWGTTSFSPYVILALLIRSLSAPVYLLGTIALSALTAIGLTNLVYHTVLGHRVFVIVPLFAFVFLVSLGQDFNILTITRIREEVTAHGMRRGVATAVALTGGVVSSAGLVMAASFLQLVSVPVVEASELGFAVMVGLLLDTFVVRPLLVPALAMLLGRWNWVWPDRTSLLTLYSRPGKT